MRNYAIVIALIVLSAAGAFCKSREVKGIQKWAMFPEPEKYNGIYPEGTSERDIFADKMAGLISMLPYPAREWEKGMEDISFLTIKIDKNGRTSGFISKDTLNAFDSTALKLLDIMPKKMIPALADDGKPVGIMFTQPVIFSKDGSVKPELEHSAVFEGGEKYIGNEKKLEEYNTGKILRHLRKNIKYHNSGREMVKSDGIIIKMTVNADGKTDYYMVKKCQFPALNESMMSALDAYDGKIVPAQYVTGEKTESTIYLHIIPIKGRLNRYPPKNEYEEFMRASWNDIFSEQKVENRSKWYIEGRPSSKSTTPATSHYTVKI